MRRLRLFRVVGAAQDYRSLTGCVSRRLLLDNIGLLGRNQTIASVVLLGGVDATLEANREVGLLALLDVSAGAGLLDSL